MRLTSNAFPEGGEIPTQYTQDGPGVSPPLSWSDVPPNAESLALIVDDPDAPDPAAPKRTFVHWVVTDLPPESTGIPEGADHVTGGHGHVGLNDYAHARWDGPAPPKGRHRYVFKLYALDRTIELEHPTKSEVEREMRGHAEAKLIGTYERPH
jgi:Raf kinase inhibitor-like YbhB/YbcL family protein